MELVALLAIVIICYYFYLKFKHIGGTKVPGPFTIPLLGFLPFLRKDFFRQFQEMSHKYGPVFQLKIGPKKIIVLNDWKSINEAFNRQGEVFSGRPDMYIVNRVLDRKDVVTQNSSAKWKLQRKFAQVTLKDLGVGKSPVETSIEEEAEKLITYLTSKCGDIIPMDSVFFVPIANVIMNLCTGTDKIESDGGSRKAFCEVLRMNSNFFQAANIINIFPVLRYLSKSFTEFMKHDMQLKLHLKQLIAEHRLASSACENDSPRDYIDAYMKKVASMDESDDKTHVFDESNLVYDMYAFFSAGTNSVKDTLTYAILYMSVWPGIQSKVQMEIEKVIGKFRKPHYYDRHKLPYTEAVLLEIQRKSSVVSVAVPHMTKSDTKLFGFDIPANMEVWPNLWAVHHDPAIWGDPEVFRPERFLSSDGKVTRPEYLIPFSVGPRRCLGEDLAIMELFIFFTTLLQRFNFRCPLGHPPPSMEPVIGISLRPEPFSVTVEIRQ